VLINNFSYKNDDGRRHVARPPMTHSDNVTRGVGARRRRDRGRQRDDDGAGDGRSARRNMIGNPEYSQRSRSTSRSRSQHHVAPHEYICRSTSGPSGRSLSKIRAASNSLSRYDEGRGRSLSRPTSPIPNEKLILVDDRCGQLPRSKSRSRFAEVKESMSETKSTQDEPCSNDEGLSPSRRKSSAQITEKNYGHFRDRSGIRGRSKSFQSNDATTAFSSISMANVCQLASSRKFIVEMGENNEIIQVFEFSVNGTLPPPRMDACDGKVIARRKMEKGTASPFSLAPPTIKTQSRSSSRANSQEAFASSVISSSRGALSPSLRSSLRGSQGNLSQASVSFAVGSDSTPKNVGLDIMRNDSYYRRSLDINASSDDSHHRRSTVSSMSDLALEISERSSESDSRRSVRFFMDQQGDSQPESSVDTKARSSTNNIHERPIFSLPHGRSLTTTVVSKDHSGSPRQPHTLSRFVDFDPAASTTKSCKSRSVPSPTHHHIHLRPRREMEKGSASSYSLSSPTIKTRSRSSSRVNSQEAFASSVISSSRGALSSSSRSSLRGSQGNLSQASVSLAVNSDGTPKNVGLDNRSNDSYFCRSLDINAWSDDLHHVNSISDLTLEIDERSSESDSRRLVRFFMDQQGDSQPESSDDTNARSSTNNIHERPSFSKGLLCYEKSSIQKSMLTESTEETYSISALTAAMSISTNHTSRAVAEEDATMFSTLDLESDSCGYSSILLYPTAFDGAKAQASKKDSRIG
jgi:hypothetical protein